MKFPVLIINIDFIDRPHQVYIAWKRWRLRRFVPSWGNWGICENDTPFKINARLLWFYWAWFSLEVCYKA